MGQRWDAETTEEQLHRVRRICGALPGTSERPSHGAPTFFVHNRVYAMFVDNHHDDGHLAVWIAAAPGSQAALAGTWPEKYFRPPYVGVRGWVGIELERIDDDELTAHLCEAWRLIGEKKKPAPVTAAARRGR